MSIIKIIDWRIAQANSQMTGTIASPFYQLYSDSNNWIWACDVDIGQPEVLRGVPVASNNREIIYAEIGKAVALSKMNDGRWCISGLAKTCRGLGHIIYMSFEDDIATVTGEDWSGNVVRTLTLGELGDLGPGAFGALPLGAHGRFTASGSLIDLLEW
jgi:hypothetical protein